MWFLFWGSLLIFEVEDEGWDVTICGSQEWCWTGGSVF